MQHPFTSILWLNVPSYMFQNLFHQGNETRNSLNSHYIVLFKLLRDKQQISILARQVNPGRVQQLIQIYEEANHQRPRAMES